MHLESLLNYVAFNRKEQQRKLRAHLAGQMAGLVAAQQQQQIAGPAAAEGEAGAAPAAAAADSAGAEAEAGK